MFILNSLSLAYIANRDFGSGSVIEEINIEQPPVVDSLPVDAEDNLPVEEEVFVDEFIDDIPEQIIEQESNEDFSDIPMLDEGDQSEETIPQDSPTDGVR